MSRIGKQKVIVPNGTEVKLEGTLFSVKGPKGTLSRNFPGAVSIKIEGNQVTFVPAILGDRKVNALWGAYASHVKNMVEGVNNGYDRTLVLEGVGYKSDVSGNTLNLALGFSHGVKVTIPEGIKVTADKNVINISGIDKELVGQFSAAIRAMKKPEPYKGKGFHYTTEVVRRKQGKKAA